MNQKEVAKMLEVSERTLRNWKTMVREGHYPKLGRPKTSLTLRLSYARLVRSSWLRMGKPGFRPVFVDLCKVVPMRFVQRYVALLKKKERQRFYRHKRENATRVEVLKKNAVWGQDATHLGRLKSRTSIEAQVLKDRASLKLIEAKAGLPFKGEDVVDQLKRIKESRGNLPLVWMTDNGSCYVTKEVAKFLREEKVIHLRSLPRTPQHNGATERAIKELKYVTSMGKGVALAGIKDCQERVNDGLRVLNINRRYGSKNYRSALELEGCLESSYNVVSRESFYAEYLKEMRVLDEKGYGARKKRLCEREIVFGLLEKYGLVKITRGSGVSSVQKEEDFL